MKKTLLLNLGAFVSLTAVGCGTKSDNYGCETVDAQGGIVAGTWNVTGACTASYDPATSNDWCSQLVYDANGVRMAMLGHPPLRFKQGTATYMLSGMYTSELSFEGNGISDFPRSCLTAYGREPGSCDEVATALGTFLGDPGSALQSYRLTQLQLLPFYPVGLVPQPSYTNFVCADDGANGCLCSYAVGLVVPDRGAWADKGSGVLSLFSETAALPYDNDFSSDGSQMKMTGHGGMDLLGQLGLRTLTFAKQP